MNQLSIQCSLQQGIPVVIFFRVFTIFRGSIDYFAIYLFRFEIASLRLSA